MPQNMFRLHDGRLDKQYLRICSTFKMLKLCRIDAKQAIDLLLDRGIRAAPSVVGHWIDHLEKNEWNPARQTTILGNPHVGPRPQ